MTRKDRAALQLALKMMRRDPMRAKQLDDMLAAGRSWQEVAEFASYSMQFRTLRLKPWEVPPIDADDTPGGEALDRFGYFTNPTAVALLKRMKRAGVSRWHLDPMAALEAEAAK
jgi:hypothetical protein